MGTIIGRQYTPQDEQGNRDVIHPETQIDAVLDPITGKPLRAQLESISDKLVPVNPETGEPGFITPEMVEKYNHMAENSIVVDSVKPTFANGGYWFNVYDPTMTSTDVE